MILRIRICIPTYNNPTSIAEVVLRSLRETPFPVHVVDDGSLVPVEEILSRSAEPEIKRAFVAGRLKVSRHSENRGKGAAIQLGFREALALGFTHLVTIDGDGQHHPREALRLAEVAKAHPWDLVIGARRMNAANVPKSSKVGRNISNHWVSYQTSTTIRDSQSGFRLYPLFRVQNFRFFGKKYDFEIEVLIRLLWSGAALHDVDVDVFYPEPSERVTHFNKWWDNVRISLLMTFLIGVSLFRTNASPRKFAIAVGLGVLVGTSPLIGLHALIATGIAFFFRMNLTGLLLGTQISIPPLMPFLILGSVAIGRSLFGEGLGAFTQWVVGSLILGSGLGIVIGLLTYFGLTRLQARRKAGGSGKAWTGTTRGGTFGLSFMVRLLRNFGLRAAYIGCLFLIPYFYLFAPRARRSSIQFRRTLHPEENWIQRQVWVHRHLYRFAQVLTDRVYQSFQAEPAFEARADGAAHILENARKDRGLICLTAHTGAWDIAASLLKGAGFDRKFYMVNYHAEGLRFEDFKKNDAPHMLSLKSNEEHAIFKIHEALVAGNTVGLMGDRPLGSRFELVPFLGKLAPFDVTAFRLAAVSGVPLVYAFGFKADSEQRVYEMNAFPAQYLKYTDNGEDRGLQSYAWVCSYARALESMVRRYPDQWFNFFPFWSTLPPGEKGAAHQNHLLEDLKRATLELVTDDADLDGKLRTSHP